MRDQILRGRVWVLAWADGRLIEDIDTDQIFHNAHLHITEISQMGIFALGNLEGWKDFPQKTKPGTFSSPAAISGRDPRANRRWIVSSPWGSRRFWRRPIRPSIFATRSTPDFPSFAATAWTVWRPGVFSAREMKSRSTFSPAGAATSPGTKRFPWSR